MAMNFNTFQNNKILNNAEKAGWKLYPLTDLLTDDSRNSLKIKKREYIEEGTTPIVDQGKALIGGYSNVEDGFYKEDSYLVFGDHTRILKYIDFPAFIGADGVKILKNINRDIAITKYLYYFLRTVSIPDTGYNRHFKFLKEVIIPVPKIEVQIKIVNLLDKIINVIDKRQQQIEALSALKQSIFLDMFGDPNTNLNGYAKKSLKEIGKVITGNTPPRKDKDNYGDYIEWIKTNNISDDSIYLTEAKEFLSKEGKSIGRVAPENSLLVTCIAGSKSSIGKVAIANREVAFNQQINAIIPFENINTAFLFTQFKILQPYIQSFSTNSMKGMISKTNFEKIEVIVPTFKLQLKFRDKFKQIISIEEKLKDSLEKIEEMRDSLLHKAFNGELFKKETRV